MALDFNADEVIVASGSNPRRLTIIGSDKVYTAEEVSSIDINRI